MTPGSDTVPVLGPSVLRGLFASARDGGRRRDRRGWLHRDPFFRLQTRLTLSLSSQPTPVREGSVKDVRSGVLFGAVLLGAVAAAGGARPDARPQTGEAHVWYLGHAGWLVRTSEHSLIFDYTGPIDGGGLDEGTLSPALLAGEDVVLFVSHAHGDHFAPAVLGLRDSVRGLTVVLGWRRPGSGYVVVAPDGTWSEVSGARVFALHHEFDGIPEGFFLVRSGGVMIYHSGDHGTWSEPPGGVFRANIDRIAAAAGPIDIAFLAAFGQRGGTGALNQGDVYTIEALRPRVTFPMHRGGHEDEYAAFAREVSSRRLPTRLGVAKAPGSSFRYRSGKLL